MQTEDKLKLEHLAPYLPYDLTYFSPKHVATSMISIKMLPLKKWVQYLWSQ